MGWLVSLAILILLLLLPLGISAFYDSNVLLLFVYLGSLRIKVFPFQHREKKKKAKKSQSQKNTKPAEKTQQAEPSSSITDFFPLVKTVFDFLRDFKARLRVNRLELKMILAGGDPSDLAVNYGRTWIAVGNLMPLLEQFLVIKKRNIDIACDFNAEKTLVLARVDLSITILRLLTLAIYYGIRILREYMNITNQRKGGAKI